MGMKEVDIITELSRLRVDYDPKAGYHALRALLRETRAGGASEAETKPNVIKFENRMRKRKVFLGDAMRDERDKDVLNAELRKRIYKGKIKKVTTIKHYDVIDGHWLTEFEIELKE